MTMKSYVPLIAFDQAMSAAARLANARVHLMACKGQQARRRRKFAALQLIVMNVYDSQSCLYWRKDSPEPPWGR
jgi:hypothetical protein